jgi:hypothetical protein
VSHRPAIRRLAILSSLALAVAFFVALPLTSFVSSPAAKASVASGDVVFQQRSAGNSYITLLHGSTETTLSNGSNDQFPDVSPDGSRVVYTWTEPNGYGDGIAVVNSAARIDGKKYKEASSPNTPA